MTERTETDAAVEAGRNAAAPYGLDREGRLWAVHTGDAVTIIDVEAEKARSGLNPTPTRKTGSPVLRDADSFIEYVNRHATPGTEVFADVQSRAITAVLDGHQPDVPGYGDHRATLAVRNSPEWDAWSGINARMQDQVAFAEFIEQHARDFHTPDGATMLEIAQTIQGFRNVEYKSGSRLSDGNIVLGWHEETAAKAGRSGDLTIPESLVLGLRPFDGSARYRIEAALRWRVHDGRVSLGVVLISPEQVVEDAFDDIVEAVREGVKEAVGTVLRGTP